MTEVREKRAGYISAEQKNKLLALMQDRPTLCTGRFSASFSKKDGQKEWCDIATTLNAIPGGKKSWAQWRKTWQDMRSKVKSKQAAIKKHAKGTGGGPPTYIKLKENEQDILNLISDVAVNGHTSVQESVAQFDFENTEESNTVPVYSHQLINNNLNGEEIAVAEVLPVSDNVNTPKIEHISSFGEEVVGVMAHEPTFGYTSTPSTSCKKLTTSSAKKLQQAASAAQLLSETANEKLHMKRDYYKRKIEILENAENRKRKQNDRQLEIEENRLIIEERKARALEKISELLNQR